MNEMKHTNEKMTWNDQDTNLSSYVPKGLKANVAHTMRGSGISPSTLDHLAITLLQWESVLAILVPQHLILWNDKLLWWEVGTVV